MSKNSQASIFGGFTQNEFDELVRKISNGEPIYHKEPEMKEVKITEFNKDEFNYLADMIHEKLVDMGYDNDNSFSFDLTVHLEEEND